MRRRSDGQNSNVSVRVPVFWQARRPVRLSTRISRCISQTEIGETPGMNQVFACGQCGPGTAPDTAHTSSSTAVRPFWPRA